MRDQGLSWVYREDLVVSTNSEVCFANCIGGCAATPENSDVVADWRKWAEWMT